MQSIKTILSNLKEFKSWKDIWKETEELLKSRESKFLLRLAFTAAVKIKRKYISN